jgi:thermitase
LILKKALFPLLFLVLFSFLPPVSAEVRNLRGKEPFVPGEIIVRLKEGSAPESQAKALSAFGTFQALSHPHLFKIKLKPGQDVLQAVAQMAKDPAIKYAQPNYRYYALGSGCSLPTDQYFGTDGVIISNGMPVTIGWPFLKIQADKAWTLLQWPSCPPGNSSVIVAVLDSGVSRNQPDLKAVSMTGYNAIGAVDEQDSSCTFCGSSLPCNSCGYTTPYTDSTSAGCTYSMDDYGHGTYVAGIINASWNLSYLESNSSYYPVCDNGGGGSTTYTGQVDNGGFAGLAPGITLLAVKILDCTGSGTSDSIVAGTDFAVSKGARVLNFSLGSPASGGIDSAEQEALDNALANNCVIVASAGNESNLPQTLAPLDFPAAYPPVISVGATDQNDQVAGYSNGGSGLDLVAPGGSEASFTGNTINDSANKVFSSFLSPLSSEAVSECAFEPLIPPSSTTDPNFGVAAGTSAAAPFVSATAALIFSMYPTLTNTQVSQAIINNTDSLNGNTGWDSKTGYGRLNVYRALLSAGNGGGQVTNYLTTFNSPNPFYTGLSATTNITIAITQPQAVNLVIYDTAGNVVLRKSYAAADLNQNPADPQYKSYYVPWDGKNGAGQPVVTGVYFYSVSVGGTMGRNKIVVIQGSK